MGVKNKKISLAAPSGVKHKLDHGEQTGFSIAAAAAADGSGVQLKKVLLADSLRSLTITILNPPISAPIPRTGNHRLVALSLSNRGPLRTEGILI